MPSARRVWLWLATPTALVALGWAAVTLGLLLRFVGVGSRSLWFDEIVTLSVPSQPWSKLLAAAATPGTNTPPLFPLLYKLWMHAGTTDAWLYLGTALIGAAIVLCTWLAGRRLFGVPVAVAATVFCACSVYQVTYSQYVRMYGLLALTGIASVYFLLRAVDTQRRRWWLLWAGSVAACLYSFYYAGFVLIGEFAWLWWKTRRRPRLTRPALRAACLGVILYLPWLPVMLLQIHHGGTRAWMARPTIASLQYTVDQFFFTANAPRIATVGFYVVLGLIALGALLPGDGEERLLLGLVAACGILLPYFASFVVQPFYDPRYLVYGAVALYLFAARGLLGVLRLPFWLPDQRARTIAVFGVVVLVVAISVGPLRTYYSAPVSYRPDVRDATARLLRLYRPGDVVAYDDPFAFLPALWYAQQMGGVGKDRSSMPYTWLPARWVRQGPMRQVLLGKHTIRLVHWLPRGAGRVWMVTLVGPPRAHHPPRNPSWFTPPADHWKLVRADTASYRLLVQLYVRS